MLAILTVRSAFDHTEEILLWESDFDVGQIFAIRSASGGLQLRFSFLCG